MTPYTVSLPLAGLLGETPDGFPEPNLFELEGKNVEITYGILRARGEFLDYRDRQRELTFGAEEIDSLESGISRMHTVTLDADPDSHTLTLTLILPQINLEGPKGLLRNPGNSD
jgi:hypothetical protein